MLYTPAPDARLPANIMSSMPIENRIPDKGKRNPIPM